MWKYLACVLWRSDSRGAPLGNRYSKKDRKHLVNIQETMATAHKMCQYITCSHEYLCVNSDKKPSHLDHMTGHPYWGGGKRPLPLLALLGDFLTNRRPHPRSHRASSLHPPPGLPTAGPPLPRKGLIASLLLLWSRFSFRPPCGQYFPKNPSYAKGHAPEKRNQWTKTRGGTLWQRVKVVTSQTDTFSLVSYQFGGREQIILNFFYQNKIEK